MQPAPHPVQPEILRQLLRYEPDAGKLFWRERPNSKSWNTRHSGKEAMTATHTGGYKVGSINGGVYRAHRVIWAMQTGAWPTEQIDHIDCDQANNRWGNLREASAAQNSWNQRARGQSADSVKGVYWHKRDKCWTARLRLPGKNLHFGNFASRADAEAAAKAGRNAAHGEFARHQ